MLLSARSGDNAQAVELANRIGGTVETKSLGFNAWHNLPNWLRNPSLLSLNAASNKLLVAPWPDLVIAVGTRTAPISSWIKRQSGGATRNVHIGRPRMALSRFDVVVTTPQYGLPEVENVMVLPLPFAAHKQVAAGDLASWKATWHHLPRPWTVAVIGGAKFPIKLGARELAEFGTALDSFARQRGGSVILLDSPRSGAGALATVAAQIAVPNWTFERGKHENPYHAALALGDVFAVTSDSVSIVSEMLNTGKPVSVYRLPTFALRPRWSAKSGPMKYLALSGLLAPPRDVPGLMDSLIDRGLVGDFASGSLAEASKRDDGTERLVLQRIREL